MAGPTASGDVAAQAPAPRYAWYVLGILFVVYVLNFVDRQVISILAEDIKRDLNLKDEDLGDNLDETTGVQIVNKAIEAPLRTIVENAGGEGSVVINKVLEGKKDFGYDAKSEEYVDMLKAGIIDPKKVTRIALENAASVAGMILTTECALVDIKEDAPAMPPMGGGGMPGMM